MSAKARKKDDPKKVVRDPKVIAKDARLRKKPVYKSFRLQRSIKKYTPPIAGWWDLTKMSFALMWANRRPLFTFTIVFAILNLILVRGFGSSVDVVEIRDLLSEISSGSLNALTTSITTFGLLLTDGSSAGSEIAQMYQTILILLASLALIWLYRQQQAGHKVSIKMAFYRGMYPLIPFILVLLVIALQTLPGLIGNFVYTAAVSGDLLFGAFEHGLMITIMLLLILLSLYMLSSSTIALYIVTLPELTPMVALREARELVRHRRLGVFGRFLMLILITLFLLMIITVPVIFFVPVLAQWIFFLLTVLAVPFVNGYLFSMYRELLA